MIDADCLVISLRLHIYRMVILSRSSLLRRLFQRTKFERMIITSEIILEYLGNATTQTVIKFGDTMFISVNVYRFESPDPSYQWQIFYLGRKWLMGKIWKFFNFQKVSKISRIKKNSVKKSAIFSRVVNYSKTNF